MNMQSLQLLLLAAVAAFLIYRLKGVLGTRDGYESRRPSPSVAIDKEPEEEVSPAEVNDVDIVRHVAPDSNAAKELQAMKIVERGFNVTEFLAGAKTAYKWIVDGYGQGRIEDLRPYLEAEVLATFEDNIRQRGDDTSRLVSCDAVLSSKIADAAFDKTSHEAEITVDFKSRILVRESNGDEPGQQSGTEYFVEQEESWTFVRMMGQGNPNWKLAANG